MRVLKTYGGCTDGVHRKIVATRTKKEARAYLDITESEMRKYISVSGNPIEVEMTTREPNVVFITKALNRVYTRHTTGEQ